MILKESGSRVGVSGMGRAPGRRQVSVALHILSHKGEGLRCELFVLVERGEGGQAGREGGKGGGSGGTRQSGTYAYV